MLGWLHVTPEDSKTTRGQSEDWPIPPCDEFQYIANWFCELRYRYDYQELKAWIDTTGTEPNPNEIELLMGMANSYGIAAIEFRSKDHDLIPPYDGRTQEDRDNMIADKIKRSLARFK